MGQRLVITVQKNEKELAKIYYHWSAYTTSALYEARDLINHLKDNYKNERDLQLDLIRFVEGRGGCIDGGEGSKEFNKIQEIFPNEDFSSSGSRNEGLIAITEDGMDDIQRWSEGDLIVDLDDNLIENEVLDYYRDIEQFNEYYEENYTLDKIPELKNDIDYIPFDNLNNVIEELNEDHWVYRRRTFRSEDEIYVLIG